MYMKLLEQTIRELKGEELEDEARATSICGSTCASRTPIPDMNQRLMVYRRLAARARPPTSTG